MKYELIYYPKCSTCVNGLEYLRSLGIEPILLDYYKIPLGKEKIAKIAALLGGAKNMCREKTFAELDIEINQSEEKLIELLAHEPKLIQRPIILSETRAIIGRPIENMGQILA